MILTLSVVLGLAAASLAAPSQPAYGYSSPPSYQSPAQYNFDWVVKDDYSANDYGHQESRQHLLTGRDLITKQINSKQVQTYLPECTLQVTYYVDGDSGYVAKDTYEGQAYYQAHQPSYHPTPAYQLTPSYHTTHSYLPTPANRPTPYRPRPHHQHMFISLPIPGCDSSLDDL
ncbi:uncharacterized protein LOC125032352 [Penaeus chinensis]|uniref:uncharacterized protein LOC125032352 n=1 Tax=Penaeus chinensis TaxID=139456 RepID=UPI001FB6E74E|nr:uncharacterized protein LOC125032352 [Penaeus chinensis]